MKTYRLFALIVVSIFVAVLLATALNSFTRVSDSALADVAPIIAPEGGITSNAPRNASKNYLPIIFLNSATAGGAWLLAGNAGTNWLTDFLGTTDNMTLTLRVSNTIAYRIVPAVDPNYGWAPNIIGGAGVNSVSPGLRGATIAGGGNTLYPNVITRTGSLATIAGGYGNTASALAATLGGGYGNTASGSTATVGGGYGNTASGDISTVGGGDYNTASGFASFIGGGFFNTASGTVSTVGGGEYNTASGTGSTVGGGGSNTASGNYAAVPGGASNVASGTLSFAAGYHAQALHQGSFVWADSTNASVSSTGNDQFLVRANGGAGIGTNNPGLYALNVQRNGGTGQYQVAIFKNASGSGDQTTIVDLENGNASPTQWRLSVGGSGNALGKTAGQFYLERTFGGVAFQIDANRDVHFFPSLGGSCNLTNGALGWACSSDRNLKENIVRADGATVLAKVAALPVSTWNMKGTDVTHIGPMVQDFYAAFGVGEDDKHINTVDAQGVALAAIQGLVQENKELKEQNEQELKELGELKERNERELTELKELKAQNAKLDARLAALEQNAPSNALSLNALAPWAVVGLLAAWAMRRKTT